MGWANVFTAFGVVLLGMTISFVLFIIELLTTAAGCCKRMMNAYNYRIIIEPKTDLGYDVGESVRDAGRWNTAQSLDGPQ